MQYGRMILNIGFRAASAVIPGGAVVQLAFEEFGPAICEAVWARIKGMNEAERRAAIEEVAQISPAEAREMAEEAVPADLDPAARAQAIEYLSAIPMAARRTLIEGASPSAGPSLPSTQIPRRAADLLRILPLRPPRFRPGDSIPAYDYRLERMLGQGGFGEVWLATNPRRPRQAPRALKFCLDEEMRASLERETELLDRIEDASEHPHIVRLLQTALSAEPPFLVYEYVSGGDLTVWLAAQQEGRPGARPDPEAVREVLRQMADALAFAHAQGIVHRDLKPSNVLVESGGRIKLADFGIGAVVAERELAAAQTRSPLWQQQSVLSGACTPMYADRAQRRGEAVDARADVYALGVMAYQLLLGDVSLELSPYFREELEKAGVPESLLELTARCVASPQRRLADGAAVLEALGGATVDRTRQDQRGPDAPPQLSKEAAALVEPFFRPAPGTGSSASRATAGPIEWRPASLPAGWGGSWAERFLKVAAVSGALFGLAMAGMAVEETEEEMLLGLLSGVPFGLFFGLVMSVLMTPSAVAASFGERRDFEQRLGRVLKAVHYKLDEQGADCWLYKPGWRAGLFSPRVEVLFGQRDATVRGPKMVLTKIQKKLG
jgi:serine/threonine protein kinase